MTVRIGVFGGTFDPVHIGHLVTAVNVRHALRLDRLLLVVAHDPWQKTGVGRQVAPAADRFAMVKAAVGDVEGLFASDIELRRGGPSYMADTLAEVAAGEPGAELYLVVGADAAAGLDTWQRPDEIRARATLAIVDRPGTARTEPPPGWRSERVEVPRLQVSSSDIRQRLADGAPLEWLVPDAVVRCIRERGLYAPPTDAAARRPPAAG